MHARAVLPLTSRILLVIAVLCVLFGVRIAFAQTTSTSDAQLRSTIQAEVSADPRSQTMTQAQISALVDSLTSQAEAQGVTASALTYRPASVTPQNSSSSATPECTSFSCAFINAFGLDGSLPIIPIAFFAAAVLFILIFSVMREMGHPHAQG